MLLLKHQALTLETCQCTAMQMLQQFIHLLDNQWEFPTVQTNFHSTTITTAYLMRTLTVQALDDTMKTMITTQGLTNSVGLVTLIMMGYRTISTMMMMMTESKIGMTQTHTTQQKLVLWTLAETCTLQANHGHSTNTDYTRPVSTSQTWRELRQMPMTSLTLQAERTVMERLESLHLQKSLMETQMVTEFLTSWTQIMTTTTLQIVRIPMTITMVFQTCMTLMTTTTESQMFVLTSIPTVMD